MTDKAKFDETVVESCPRERMRRLCEALRAGKPSRAHFTETGEPLVFDCTPKSKGFELTLKRAGRTRSRIYRGELTVEKLETAFFDLCRLHESQQLATRAEIRQMLVDVFLGGMPCEIDFGSAGTCFVKLYRGELVLKVTATNGDCLDSSSGQNWSTDALITLLDVAEDFLKSRRPATTEESPWSLARRRLRLRRKVTVTNTALLH